MNETNSWRFEVVYQTDGIVELSALMRTKSISVSVSLCLLTELQVELCYLLM